MNRKLLYLSFYIFSLNMVAQYRVKDTIYGNVKSIREKVLFLDKNYQNYNLMNMYGDYGHSGWSKNTGGSSRFNQWWYNTPLVHYINYLKEFDDKGQLIKEEWYFKNQNIVVSYKNTFNELGDLILQKITDNGNGNVINDYDEYSILNSYDKNKNLIFSKTSQSDGSYSINSKKYDSIDNIKSAFYFNSLYPKKSRKTEYSYDKNGNLIEIKKIESNKETYGTKYEYDNKNRKTKITHHSPFIWVKTRKGSKQKRTDKGSDNLFQVFFYDNKDRIIEIQTYNQDFYDKNKVLLSGINRKIYKNNLLTDILHYDKNNTLLYFEKYVYDIKKRKTKKTVKKANQNDNTRMLEYSYSNHDLPIRLLYVENRKKTEIDFEYEFDSKNNWIKQTKTVNGKKLFVWIRKIEYFE